MVVPLTACSNLLGITDPSAGSDAGSGSGTDASIDAMLPQSGDYLKISIADFKVAIKQRVRFHVTVTHKDTSTDDVTKSADLQLVSSDATIGTVGPLTANAVTVDGVASGMVTFTAKYKDAAVATVKMTVTTAMCHPVINELMTGTSAGGGSDEFVELYNPCNVSFNVSTWTLNYRAKGSTSLDMDGTLLASLAGTMEVGELRVYGGPNYNGTGAAAAILPKWTSGISTDGAIGLRSGAANSGPLVDSIAYGMVVVSPNPTPNPFIEGTPFVTINNDADAARAAFDGADTDDNSKDFKATVSAGTPGALNVP